MNQRTADARTSSADVDECVEEDGPQEEGDFKVTEPNDKDRQEEDGVGQRQCRQVITRTVQLVPRSKERKDVVSIAQDSDDNNRSQVVVIEPVEAHSKPVKCTVRPCPIGR